MLKEQSTPQKCEWAESANITDLLEDKKIKTPHRTLYKIKKGSQWDCITTQEFHKQVTKLAKGLIAWGVELGDRIGIMSRTRYEWTLIDFAILYAGGVPVPVYETSSAHQVAHILKDSGAKAIFVETTQLAHLVNEATAETGVRYVTWVIEKDAISYLQKMSTSISDDALEIARKSRDTHNLATIVYTSGTTGEPKGCMLTHGNLMNLSSNALSEMGEVANAESSTIIFLPLAHVLGRAVQILALESGMVVGHVPNIRDLSSDLQTFNPTMLVAVPRVLEKVFEGAEAKAAKGGERNKRIFDKAVAAANEWSKAKLSEGVSWGDMVKHTLYDKLVYSKLRQALGGKIKYVISGGGPLNPELGHFYHAIGIKVLEGYGLTETSAPISVGRADRFSLGNVGKLLPGSSARIAEDGELELKGVGVFPGYYNRPVETKDAFTQDGWFKTGDLARFDDRGLLQIIGRKKEIIVTAGGKNVIPNKAESSIKHRPMVSQAMLVGDNRPFISALVTLDPDTLPDQLEHIGLPRTMSIPEAANHPKVRDYVQAAIDEANRLVSKAESVREFRILPADFTEKNGYLTPSQKIKRSKVLQDFSSYIDDIYSKGRKNIAEKASNAKEVVAERLHTLADNISPTSTK